MADYQKIYLRVTGTIGDTPLDEDKFPDRVMATGTAFLKPNIRDGYAENAVGPDGIAELNLPAPIQCEIANGWLTFNGDPYVWLLVSRELWNWNISFPQLRVNGVSKKLDSFNFTLEPATPSQLADPLYKGINLAPLIEFVNPETGQKSVKGDRGWGIGEFTVVGDNLILTLDDPLHTQLPPRQIPQIVAATAAKNAAEAARDKSQEYRDSAFAHRQAAEAARGGAETAEDAADAARGIAIGARDQALIYRNETNVSKDAAAVSEGNALASANSAITKAGEANASKIAAGTSETNALGYKNAAEAARDIAITNRDQAVTAKNDAVTARGDAITAKTDAVAAKVAAEAARDAAVGGVVPDNGVTTIKIQDLAVTGAKIDNLTITGGKLADSTVAGSKLSNQAVTAGKIANNTITATQIADGTITATQIADSGITSVKLNSKIVTAAKIADDTITALQIAPNAITASELADASVDTAAIVDANVTLAKLAMGAKTTGFNYGIWFDTRKVGLGDGLAPLGFTFPVAFKVTKITLKMGTVDGTGTTTVMPKKNATNFANSISINAGSLTNSSTYNQDFAIGDDLIFDTTLIGGTPGKQLKALVEGYPL